MKKDIKLLTVDGVKAIPMMANGGTPFRYRALFHEDLMKAVAKFGRINTDIDSVDFELPAKLAFIMNQTAEGKDMKSLNIDDFYAWLDFFEGDTFWANQDEISAVYLVNQMTTSNGKK